MDSAEHHHGASAATPTQAPTLTEANASQNNPPCCKTTNTAKEKPPSASSTATATATEKTIAVPTKASFSIVPMSATTNKKRPLATVSAAASLTVPCLKKKPFDATKGVPVKAKKTLKKKKKKYSSILSGMMKPKKSVDIQKERESLRKNLGGGNFCKVDKI
jgi:hypothetical protein